MFIQEKKYSKVSSALFRIIIVLVAAYATYHIIVLHDRSDTYLWIIGVVLVLAFIFDQVSHKGYSALEYFEAERARRQSRIENIVISIFFAFVLGATIVLFLISPFHITKFGKDDLGFLKTLIVPDNGMVLGISVFVLGTVLYIRALFSKQKLKWNRTGMQTPIGENKAEMPLFLQAEIKKIEQNYNKMFIYGNVMMAIGAALVATMLSL